MRLSKKNTKTLVLTSIMGASTYLGGTSVHAAVINGASDITPVNVHDKEASGVAMTYTAYGNNQVASGSGVFVAPNIMLTVAHNYLDKDKANGTSFVRGGNGAISYVVMNSDSAKRGNNTSSGYDDIIPKGNIHYYNDKEFVTSYSGDLAAVVTEKPVEAMTNGEDHARDLGVAKQGDKITFMGYPNDFSSKRLSEESKAKLVNGKMYKVSGTLSNLDTTTGSGTYNTSALGGFSGGPIFNEKGELVGIHQHGTNTDFGDDSSQHGGGLFFTDKHRKWINTMIAEHGIKGWFVNGNDKYYYDDNHKALVNTERDINGAKYRFDSKGRATLISGVEKGRVVVRIKNTNGEKLSEHVVAEGNVGSAVNYNFKTDSANKAIFDKNPNAVVVSVDGENINKKFSESWNKEYVSKLGLGDTYIDVLVKSENFVRTEVGKVDTDKPGVPTLVPDEKIKGVPNGEKNFYSTVALTSPAGLGSGTLINDDTIVTVAHNFVHLNTKNNPITVDNNIGGSGTVYLATLPNGKQVRFGNEDIKFWNREGFINGFKNDLAVVKLKNKFTGETGANLHEDVSNLKQGDTIHVFGYPKGKMNPIIDGKVETVENYGANIMGVGYQGSAPGMSGGGMYNAQGELIGVHQNGVEGFRAGGITFSKEQLDWIKGIVNNNEIKPVYLKDELRNDDKKDDKKDYDKDRLEKEKLAKEKREKEEADRLAKEKLEKERLEKLAAEKAENERLAREKLEKERLEKERLEKERLEKEQLEKERLEKERLEKAENERLVKEKLEKEKLEREKSEKERLEKERMEKERLEKERLEKLAAEKVENERLEHEKLEKERFEKERLEKLAVEKAENERLAREKLEKERLEKERLEKLAVEKAENERLAREKLEKEHLEKERLEKLAREKEAAENERLAREKLEKERLEKERLEKLAREKEEAEKLAREKEMQAKKEKEEAENLARLKAETEKKAKDKEEQERLGRERLELENFAREKAEKERLARENAEKLAREKEEAEKLAREKADAERLAREKLEKERLAKEQAEKLAREKADAERLAREKLEKERLVKEQTEKLVREKQEAERLAKEKLEREKVELEKFKREEARLLKEQAELELAKKAQKEREEVERLNAEKLRLEKEKLRLEVEELNKLEKDRLEKERIRLEEEKARLEKLDSETIKTDKGTPLINEIPEYSGVLAGNGLDGEGNIIKSLVNEVPEYKLEDIPKNESKDKESSDKNTIKNETKESTNKTSVKNSNEVKKELENFDNKHSVDEKMASINSKTTDKSILKPNSARLPETGSQSNAALATFAIGLGSILGLRRRKKEDKE